MAQGIGLTVGGRSLRAVEVRRKGPAWQVSRVVVADLSGSDDDARVAEARGLLAGAGVRGPGLVGLSGKDLIVRYTHAPRVPDWRLEMLMGFEIQEVAEQSGGDVAADWALLSLPASAGDDDTVLVALARNAHLGPRLAAARAAGVSVLGGCPRSIGLYHAFVTNCTVPPGEVTLLLHLGSENSDIAIQRDGALLFARNMAGGGQPFTDALAAGFNVSPDTAERMKIQKGNLAPRGRARYADSTEEKVANTLLGTAGNVVAAIHSSIMFCKAQTKLSDLRVDRVLVSGAGAKIRGMAEYLSSGLGVPVEPLDPFETVDLTPLPQDVRELVQADGPSLAAALGLAQMAADPKAFRLEILPAADRKRRDFVRHTSWLLASGVAAAAGLFVLYSTKGFQEREATRNDAQAKVALEKASRLREEGEQKKARVAQALRRVTLLQGEIMLGLELERALDAVQTTVDSDRAFDALHFPAVRTAYQTLDVPEAILAAAAGSADPADGSGDGKGDDKGDDKGKARGGRDDGEKKRIQARVPVVSLEGVIQVRELPPDKVYSMFTQALQDRVGRDLKGAEMRLEGGLEGRSGRFKVSIPFFEGFRPLEK